MVSMLNIVTVEQDVISILNSVASPASTFVRSNQSSWFEKIIDIYIYININYFLKSRRLVRSNKCRRRGCNGIEDADHILFNCHNIEHANHQQRFKNNIKANFQIPPGVQLLSLKDVLSAMSDAEEYNIGNLFQLAKLIHNFISLHHDSGAIWQLRILHGIKGQSSSLIHDFKFETIILGIADQVKSLICYLPRKHLNEFLLLKNFFWILF